MLSSCLKFFTRCELGQFVVNFQITRKYLFFVLCIFNGERNVMQSLDPFHSFDLHIPFAVCAGEIGNAIALSLNVTRPHDILYIIEHELSCITSFDCIYFYRVLYEHCALQTHREHYHAFPWCLSFAHACAIVWVSVFNYNDLMCGRCNCDDSDGGNGAIVHRCITIKINPMELKRKRNFATSFDQNKFMHGNLSHISFVWLYVLPLHQLNYIVTWPILGVIQS